MRRFMPPAQQVRDVIERILSSDVFARSERARDLLRYIVDQDLAGNADRLKGFSIAVDVFGKSDQFDPSTDTVVRVQAGRLRELLSQYYAGEGAGDALRIAIPRGSYVPEYRMERDFEIASVPPLQDAHGSWLRAAEDAPPVAGRPTVRRPVRRIWLASMGLCLAIIIASGAVYRLMVPPQMIASKDLASVMGLADMTGSVLQDMLPSVFFHEKTGGAGAGAVAGALRRGLAGFDTIQFIGRPYDGKDPTAARRIDFSFAVEENAAGDAHIELQNVRTGKVLMSRSIAVTQRDQSAIDDVVADVLTSVAPVSGIIYANLSETGAQTRLVECLFLNEDFYRAQSRAAHREAYQCLEELAAAGMKSAQVYSELAALNMQAVTSPYDYPPDASFDKALEYARLAVQLSPDSPLAHRSMGYVLSRTASSQESMRWTRKAYELNTFDLGMAASYGYALIFDGAYAEGVPILRRAVEATSAHPTWWDYGLFLGQFMLEDMQAASDAVSALASSNRAHYIAARLIAAHGTRDPEEAAALVMELQAGHSSFAADPERFFRKGNYPKDMESLLLGGLREAGLSGAM